MKSIFTILTFTLLAFGVKAQVSPLFLDPTDRESDSLKANWKAIKNDTLRMAAMRDLCYYYLETNSDSALYFIEQVLPIARRLRLRLWESDARDLYGLVLGNKGDFVKALKSLNEALAIANETDSEKGIWRIERFTNDRNPVTARISMKATIQMDLGGLYFNTENFDKGAAGYVEAAKTASSINDYTVLALCYNRLAQNPAIAADVDSSLRVLQVSLDYMKKSGFYKYEGSVLRQMAQNYFKKQKIDLARSYFAKAITSSTAHNNNVELGDSYCHVAKFQLATGDVDSALSSARVGLMIMRSTSQIRLLPGAYSTLASIFQEQNRTDSAFYYLQKVTALKDSLAGSDKIRQFQNIGFDEQLRVEELEKDRIETKSRIRTYTLVAGLLIFSLFALFLYRNIRQKQKANKILEGTLNDLKATQSQLIQSEKMASLGELTAGIAHEIQNPLNFVNNFSEVNKELIAEMKEEINKGNLDEAKALADMVSDNEDKIGHHGKRADGIVKGMLQHSRSGNGQKEVTDINALADEYLRLAYHGLRAKDNSFNATLKTDYDSTIGNISIMPQEMGRVILNLITNAFYAVKEKKSTGATNYDPTVSVKTRRIGHAIEISVGDNGSGIPQHILDKIFQPFFTTKPAGQGTGLGLSLSYDIVKAHNGTITVKTMEGKGTEFTIQLPSNA